MGDIALVTKGDFSKHLVYIIPLLRGTAKFIMQFIVEGDAEIDITKQISNV